MSETEDLPVLAEQLAEDLGRWPTQLAEMTEIIQDELARALPDLSPAEARRTACRQVCRFIGEYGGTRPYIPKHDAIRRALRDLSIWSEHDGTVDGEHGIRALGAKHGLSEVAVWAVLRQQRKLNRRPLPGDPCPSEP